MSQYAFHLELLPGRANEYVRLHSPVPEGILTQLAAAGIHDYSIFVDGDHVFGVFRYVDEQRLADVMEEDVDPEWSSAVVALTSHRDVDEGLHVPIGIRNVFRFERGSDTERTGFAETSLRSERRSP